MAKKNKNKNKKFSKAKQTQAEESQPLPTAEPTRVLPKALQATVKGIEPDGVPVLGKLAQEKITDTSPPERYEKRQLVIQQITSPLMIHTYRFITIPPKHVSRPDDPDGHAECIITGGTQKRLFDCPSFLTKRVPQAKPDTTIIKESETGGLGVFAGCDITYGELLFAERPLLVNPAKTVYHIRGRDWVHDYTYEDHMKIMDFEQEQRLELAFMRMDDKKEAYMTLTNATENGSGPLLGIEQTNAFGLDLNELARYRGLVPEPHENSAGMNLTPEEEADMYAFTGKNASRMNHSCSPNIEFEFSLASFSLQFHPMRDIKAGEEIFVAYTDEYVPAAERREQLKRYGFTCACTACSRATPESDKFRETSKSRMKALDTLYHTAKVYDQKSSNRMLLHSVRDTILPNILEFRRKLREEGLGVMFGPYPRSTLLLHEMHVHLGMLKEPEGKSVLKDVMAWMTMKAEIQGRNLSEGGDASKVHT